MPKLPYPPFHGHLSVLAPAMLCYENVVGFVALLLVPVGDLSF